MTDQLTANFTFEPPTLAAPVAVQFTDLSTGNPTFWHWSYKYGASTLRNPRITFPEPGEYVMELKVRNSTGTSTTWQTIRVGGTVPPVLQPIADFVATPLSGIAPLTVVFTNKSQNADFFDWKFDFNDFSSQMNPTFTFGKPGEYTVTLIAKRKGYSSTPFSRVITVLPPPPFPPGLVPIAAFAPNVTSGAIPFNVVPNDFSMFGPTRWEYTTDTGLVFNEPRPYIPFTTGGQHTITLRVSNANGTSQPYTVVINAIGPLADNSN